MYWSNEWYFGDWELSVTWALDHWQVGPTVIVSKPLYFFSLGLGPIRITLYK